MVKISYLHSASLHAITKLPLPWRAKGTTPRERFKLAATILAARGLLALIDSGVTCSRSRS